MKDIQEAFFDVDGTLYPGHFLDLVETFAEDGYVTRVENDRFVEEIGTLLEARDFEYNRFLAGAVQAGAVILAGHRENEAHEITRKYLAEKVEWFGYVVPLLEELEKFRFNRRVVSGEPFFVAEEVRRALGMTAAYGTEFGVGYNGRFDGNVKRILDSREKGIITSLFLPYSIRSIAFGNTMGDEGMLMVVRQAICINPDKELARLAARKKWRIETTPNERIYV